MKKRTLIVTAAAVTLLGTGMATASDSFSLRVNIGVPVEAPRRVVYVREPVEYRVVERYRPVYEQRRVYGDDDCRKVVKKVYVNDRLVEKRVKKVCSTGPRERRDHGYDGHRSDHHRRDRDDRRHSRW